jgi:hypothetical protein
MGRLRGRYEIGVCIVELVFERDGSVTIDRILIPDPPDPELEEALFESFTTRRYRHLTDETTPLRGLSSITHCPVRIEDARRDRHKRPLPVEPRRHRRNDAGDAWLLDADMARPVLRDGDAFPAVAKLQGPTRSSDGFCPTRIRIDEHGATTVLGPRFPRHTADPELDAALNADLSGRRYRPARLDDVPVAVETIVVPPACPTLLDNEPPIEVAKPRPEPDCTPECPCQD